MCIDSGPLNRHQCAKKHAKNQIETPATDDEELLPPLPAESYEDYFRRTAESYDDYFRRKQHPENQIETHATDDEELLPPPPAESYEDYIRRKLAFAT